MISHLAPGGARPAARNKVTQPRRGLPRPGADRGARGGVKAGTDWVRVEQK